MESFPDLFKKVCSQTLKTIAKFASTQLLTLCEYLLMITSIGSSGQKQLLPVCEEMQILSINGEHFD